MGRPTSAPTEENRMDRESALIVLEPKYCELCGGLWLRPAGSPGDCCPHCRTLETELALARRVREEARPA